MSVQQVFAVHLMRREIYLLFYLFIYLHTDAMRSPILNKEAAGRNTFCCSLTAVIYIPYLSYQARFLKDMLFPLKPYYYVMTLFDL